MNKELQKIDDPKKLEKFEGNKILVEKMAPEKRDSLSAWIRLYFNFKVIESAPGTVAAKKRDLQKFLAFFEEAVGNDYIDHWTPAISRAFQHHLQNAPTAKGKPHAATSINRIIATVRHAGRWINKQRPLLAGDPLADVKDLAPDHPEWSGLTNKEINRLKSACEQRLSICKRQNQNPQLETAVFYVLLHTGLRESELCALNLEQYQGRKFINVKRKGKRIMAKVPLPSPARQKLDEYLDKRRGREPGPLFISRTGARITPKAVRRLCQRLAYRASLIGRDKKPKPEEMMKLNPHDLRHTFLKRVADKKGVHVAQEMSGNVNPKIIFRYTKPSEAEMEETVEGLFD